MKKKPNGRDPLPTPDGMLSEEEERGKDKRAKLAELKAIVTGKGQRLEQIKTTRDTEATGGDDDERT